MSKAGVQFISFIVSCLAVALVWTGAVLLTTDQSLSDTPILLPVGLAIAIFCFAAIPAFISIYLASKKRRAFLLLPLLQVGAAIGATGFVVFFGSWTSGPGYRPWLELVGIGGGLGALGAFVHWLCASKVFQIQNKENNA